MEIQLKFGKGTRTLRLPDRAEVVVMTPRDLPVIGDLPVALHEALDAPLDTLPLEQRPRPSSVAIAVPDETRPAPLKRLLPVLLKRIFRAWPELGPKNVSVVVGGGLHPAPDTAQMARILPEDLYGCSVVSHDALTSPMTSFGTTSRGTPVEINAAIGEAELKIVVGMVDPHQFQGMTGGSKGITIGCASKTMIERNHSLMADPAARVGNIADNPTRLDLNEAGRMIGIDLAVNVCLNPAKQAVGLFVGECEATLRAGAAVTEQVYGLPLDRPFEIVIASCGGEPKDICLYQAQKGLNMASQCAEEGGKILLLAACGQGVGDPHYENYVRRFSCPVEQMREFADQGFRMGAHKAFLFSRTLTRFTVVVDSEMDAQTLAQCHLTKGDAQITLDAWLASYPDSEEPRIAVVPNANTTYFYRSTTQQE
ncbi:MAG: nickel-dependent lactate racemase [Desulfovibrionales bacterium]|nr:MAG: nickel-dependent lactate racemase [Desulfovibrionales bacterium]